ncbi:MAG: LamG-like jellyroll fold domain-containing protein, partial [Anaerolineae bacterium]
LLDDVRVYRKALSVNEVSLLYLAAPGFQLHFDEAKGASTFHDGSDNNHNGFCSGDWCPKAGVKGQMGLAAEFDGQNDIVQLANASALGLRDSSFTVMAWIRAKQLAKPNSPGNGEGDSSILGTDEESTNNGLHLVVRNGKPYMGFHGNDTTGTTEIKPNFWYHLTWRYDKDKGEQAIFVNGSMDAAQTGHGPFQGNGTVYVGRALGGRYFHGRVDELAIYPSALSDNDIRDIFLYQGSWIEERESHEITIDTDTPSSVLSSYKEGSSNYRANKDAMFGIQASDPTSSVKLAELGVRKNGQSSYTWVGAPACQDSADAAWCPTFKPADFGGEGTYTFQTRATDATGHRESPSKTYSLYVDGTPPNVTTTTADGALLTPRADPTRPNTWLLSFSGTVSDPNLSSGAAGSGLVPDSVRVRLVDADGQTAGKTTQKATVFGGSQWSVEYPLYQANPTGVYILTVEAADNVGNKAATALATFQLDASPAGAELDTDAVPANIISNTLTLQGVAQDTPSLPDAVLRLHLDEAAGSRTFIDTSGRGNHATCSGSACPAAGEIGKFGRALQFDGANSATVLNSLDFAKADYTIAAWFQSGAAATQDILTAVTAAGQPGIRLQLDSAGKLHYLHRFPADSSTGSELAGSRALNDSAWHHLAAVKSGSNLSLYVDSIVVASGSDSSAATAALAVTLGQNFNGLLDDVQVYKRVLTTSDIRSLAQTQVSGVAGVDIAFTPRSGSAPFYDGSNGDSQLRLPFEQNFAADGASLPNTADETRPAALHTGAGDATNKAVSGAVGSYALQLDGVDDYLSVDNGAGLTADQLSVCAWVKPEAGNPAGAVIAQRWGSSGANWALRMGSSGFAWQHSAISTYNNMQSEAPVAGQWRHLCGVASDIQQLLYVNGEKVTAGWGNSASGSGNGLNLGRQVGSSAHYFKGAIDDVRVYPRAISANEVNALYHSGWQPAGYSSGLQAQTVESPKVLAARAQASSNLACQTYSSSDTPVAINDYKTSLSSISVPDDFSVDDINLTVNIQHTWDGDLSGYLIAPNGEQVTLFNRRGGGGDNYTSTQFDDEAAAIISSGAAPFTGQFRPESALSAAEGQPAQGAWQLRVEDHAGGDQGQISNWSLELCSPPVPPPPPILAAAGSYDTPGYAQGVAVAGHYAYVADGYSGLRVIDISNPAGPREVGFYDTPSSAWGVAVAGHYAYVADGYSGLRVIDISNPAGPREVGFYDTPGYAHGVAVAGNYAYVADYYSGLRVIDISNPAGPSEAGSYDTPGYAQDVTVAGNHAYVADYQDGLWMIDISDPAHPTKADSYDTPGIARDVVVAGNYAYVADGGDGLI